jgi:phosphatidylethanolamine/phosphatidyl-N-methylethanolamine N-methyltransferase
MGAVSPTSRALARLMVEVSRPDPSTYVLETGAGAGVVTEALIESGVPPERIVSVEYDPEFCRLLSRRFPDVNVLHGDAFDLDRALGEFRSAAFLAALSGVPVLLGDERRRVGYVEAMLDRVIPGGVMTQLSYAFSPPVPPAPGRFTVEPTRWVPLNFPPGRVWIYRRLRA